MLFMLCIVCEVTEITMLKWANKIRSVLAPPPFGRLELNIHCGAKKLHHFIFTITLSKRFRVK